MEMTSGTMRLFGQVTFTIRAGRRRPAGGSSGPRERADAPRREREQGGGGGAGGFGSSGGSSGGSGGGGFGGFGSGGSSGGSSGGGFGGFPLPGGGGGARRGGCLGSIGMIVLLIILAVVLGPSLFGGGGGVLPQEQTFPQDDQSIPPADVAQPTRAPLVINTLVPRKTSTPRPLGSTGSSGGGEKWLVMLYQDADDKILEQDITLDLNEAERVGSSDNVTIVAQIDRYRGGFSGDGNWNGARRYLVTRDEDLNRVGSQVLEDLGEVNMSDTRTLVDFATWAMQTYPADRYALILSDHGMGWPGGWSDTDSAGRASTNAPLGQAAGDQLYLNEIDDALGQIRQQTGVDKIDLLGMDACLMGHLEVLSALEPHARYAVLSQETEPALGWAYASVFDTLEANPGMDGAQLGQAIVQSYIRNDERIVDDNARADLLRQSSGMSGLFGGGPRISADQLARQMGGDITLATIDLSRVPELMDRVNELSFALQSADQGGVARAKRFSRSFTSIFGSQVPPSYIDLGNFAQLLQREVNNNAVAQAAGSVVAAIDQSVVAINNGPNKRGATGVSIYYPNSQLYNTGAGGPRSYTVIADRFAQDSLWDDFLAFHYTGARFQAAPAAPSTQLGAVRAPGAGQITLSPLQLSKDSVAPGETVLLSSQISGQNIGYIYLFVGYLDRTGQSIYVADMDYLESATTREVDGVFYPDWGTGGAFTLEYEWEPVVFGINDGQNLEMATLRPRNYGATAEEALYRVDGIYRYQDGEQRYAQLEMQNGNLLHVYGFNTAEMSSASGNNPGAPWEIVPEPGDQFTLLEQWLDTNGSGQPMTPATQEGATLTFRNQNFTWELMDAPAGDYVVGFIAEDLDGNQYATYAPITVR